MGLNFYREDPRSPHMNLKPARVGGSGDGAGNTAPHEFCSTSFASERVPASARCTWGASNRNQNFHLRGYGARVKNFIDHAFDPSRHRSLMSLGMVAGSIANAVLILWVSHRHLRRPSADGQGGEAFTPNDASRPLVRASNG
jgi:hypothetical protein